MSDEDIRAGSAEAFDRARRDMEGKAGRFNVSGYCPTQSREYRGREGSDDSNRPNQPVQVSPPNVVQNPPNNPYLDRPPILNELDRQIKFRRSRIEELQSNNEKYANALRAIQNRTGEWIGIMEDSVKDSQEAQLGAIVSCIDLVFDAIGLSATKQIAALNTDERLVREHAQQVKNMLEAVQKKVKSRRVKNALKDMQKCIDKTAKAGIIELRKLKIDAKDAKEAADLYDKLEKGINAASIAADIADELDTKGKVDYLSATKKVVDFEADILKDRLMNVLQSCEDWKTVSGLALLDWGKDYFYHSWRFCSDWVDTNTALSSLDSDERAASFLRQKMAYNTDEMKRVHDQLKQLELHQADPQGAQSAIEQVQAQQWLTAPSTPEAIFQVFEELGDEEIRNREKH